MEVGVIKVLIFADSSVEQTFRILQNTIQFEDEKTFLEIFIWLCGEKLSKCQVCKFATLKIEVVQVPIFVDSFVEQSSMILQKTAQLQCEINFFDIFIWLLRKCQVYEFAALKIKAALLLIFVDSFVVHSFTILQKIVDFQQEINFWEISIWFQEKKTKKVTGFNFVKLKIESVLVSILADVFAE